MFYPQLSQLKTKYNITDNLVDKFDTWLACIPSTRRKHISPSFFAREYKIDEILSLHIFEAAAEIGLLSTNYEVYCPICEEYIDSFASIEELEEEGPIFSCGSHNFDITKNTRYILMTFNLLLSPSGNPKKKRELIVV